jgi:imidazolonepropionase-like amidohydrolase
MAAVLAALACSVTAQAQTPAPAGPSPSVVLFRNVRVFNGTSPSVSAPTTVLVRGNLIASIGGGSATPEPGTTVIEGGGRTLMPGLIDAHWHAMYAAVPLTVAFSADAGYLNLLAAREANDTLMRGFTSVRDVAGPTFGLKRAIDEGVVTGPRIWPSGAQISQTGGHGDFRNPNDLPAEPGAPLSTSERTGASIIADGPDEVRKRAREQLMKGASHLKLAGGGGIASDYDPLDVSQYTEAEFRAAVEAAENWGTYVTVHAYTPRAIQTAIRGGVKCIEHGQLLDEPTARLMAERGIWLSIQPFLDDQDAIRYPEGSVNRAKQLLITKGTDTAYALAKKYKVKTAWGTDTLFDPRLAARQGAAGQDGAVVLPRRSTEDGHRGQRRAAGAVRPAQPLPGQAGCCRGRRARRPAAR